MAIDVDSLSARAAKLTSRIEELQQLIGPLQAELLAVRRKIDGAHAGRASAARRSHAAAERNHLICDDARKLGSGRAYVPVFWLQELAEKHGISSRQVARILQAADIKVER